jgi:Pvc16 N-terminal domain
MVTGRTCGPATICPDAVKDSRLVASFQAIGSVAEAVAGLLAQTWQPSLLNNIDLTFDVYQGKDFHTPMTAGVSVFVYQVCVNKVQRTLPPADPGYRRPLPIDISLLLTAWAQDASSEHDILGWAMRTIDDNPILSSGFLNSAIPGVFRPDETVELVPAELTNEEVFQLWQVLPNSLQLSAPYVARVVRLESTLSVPEWPAVVTRELEFGSATA